jgi:hypothetical protein
MGSCQARAALGCQSRHRNRILRGIEYLLWILCAGQVLIWAWTLFTPITFSWQFADGESLDSWTTYDGFIQFQVNHGVLDIHKNTT